jgi:hypothetical protein
MCVKIQTKSIFANKFDIKINCMVSAIAQRIGKFIIYKKVSRREFASRLGYASSEKINRLFRKDGAKPGFDIVEDIANKFVEINTEWLVTGRGDMLKYVPAGYPDENNGGDFMAEEREDLAPKFIAYVSMADRETYRIGYNQGSFVSQMTMFSLPGLGPGTHRMFEVDGKDLYPVLYDKDKIVARRCTIDQMSVDKVFILLTRKEGIVVMRLSTLDIQSGKLRLKGISPHREEYPFAGIRIADILEIWEGTFRLTRDFPEATGIDQKVKDLEIGLRQMEERLKQNGM